MKFAFLLIWAGTIVFLIGTSSLYAQQIPPDVIEIVVDGKRYRSIQDYRRDRIKDVLSDTLSESDLEMFTSEELCGIIKEIREQKISDVSSTIPKKLENLQSDARQQSRHNVKEDVLDLSPSQMQDMLDRYYKEHKELDPILLDPEKVKNIIIEPKSGSETIPQN